MLKTWKHTVQVSFNGPDGMAPSHLEEFVKAALQSEVGKYMPFDPLGRIDRGSIRLEASWQEPHNVNRQQQRYCQPPAALRRER